ncbi:hypothetical protein C8C83_1658 [Flavobacterium sp. 90]|nr:hypothetical protein C8C82_1960 [Flavobacterium sp. 81]TCK53778.1 hypothetical protein C8C83_1658 [Flavobacterium sp. 90]
MIFSYIKIYSKIKSPSKETLDGLVFILIVFFYFNKSKTKDGNKPKAIFNTIEIIATA